MAYTAIMVLAMGVGIVLSWRGPPFAPMSRWERLGIGLGAFVGGMLGAKLPFVLMDWPGLLSGRAWLENGKTIVFGLVGGYVGVEVAKWLLGVRVKTGDSFAVPVAGAIAVGRWSCLVAGCCHGVPTTLPWGVDFGDGVARHPTQVYESIFHAMMAALLAWLGRRGWFRGQLIKIYIITYLIYRVFSEFIRPEPRVLWGLTAYQVASLGLVPVFAWLWWRDANAARVAGAAPVA